MGMMINRRRVCGGEKLPYDAEIEYLESDGNAYIYPNIWASSNSIIKIHLVDFFKTENRGKWPFGGRKSYLNNAFGIFFNSETSYINVPFGSKSVDILSVSSLSSTSALVELKKGLFSVDGKSYNFSASYFKPTNTIILFGLNNGGNVLVYTGIKIGRCYLSDGNKEVDFIPVRVGQVGYMYDKVSGQLFGSGTGNFILGPDK